MMNFFQLGMPALIAILLFAAATGIGRLILRPWRSQISSSLEFHGFACAIGMALLSHLILLLGICGAWTRAGFIALSAVAVAAALAGFRPIQKGAAATQPLREGGDAGSLVVSVVLALVLACIALRTTTPPANYDVLEYHLGAVCHWLRGGGIRPFEHLFYSALPFEVEMWYAGGCFFEGNPLMPATPKLINFGVLLFTVGALYSLASSLCRRRSLRILACLLFTIHPLTEIVSQDALNDLGLTWFAALGALAWLRWYRSGHRLFLVLFAVFLGLTVCCKYTAVGLIVFPAALILVPVAVGLPSRKAGDGKLVNLLVTWLLVGGIAAAVFAPWAIKNVMHYGNPVYPLLSGIFPSSTWSPEQTAFYVEAHGRTNPATAAYWRAFGRALWQLGPWLIAAVAAGCFVRNERTAAAALTAAVGAGLLIHSVFTHNPARFILPFLPVLVCLAARFLDRAVDAAKAPVRVALLAPFVLWAGFGVLGAIDPGIPVAIDRSIVPVSNTQAPPSGARLFSWAGFPLLDKGPAALNLAQFVFSRTTRIFVLGQALNERVVESQRFINEMTEPDSRVFLLFEARIACFDRDVEVGSVFDRSPLLELASAVDSAEALLRQLAEEGFGYLYVNEFELKRLSTTYGGAEITTDDFASLLDRYPPFSQDPRFSRCRDVICAFIGLCRQRAVYSMVPNQVAGIWIARIR